MSYPEDFPDTTLTAGPRPNVRPRIHIKADGTITISDIDFRRGPDGDDPVIINESGAAVQVEHCGFPLGGIINGLWFG